MGADRIHAQIITIAGTRISVAMPLETVRSRQAFIWPYDENARLAGEHLYEDKTSLTWEEVDESELTTADRVKEIQKELLGQLHARFGEKFWVYEAESATA